EVMPRLAEPDECRVEACGVGGRVEPGRGIRRYASATLRRRRREHAFRRFKGAQKRHQRAWRDIRKLESRPGRGARIDDHGEGRPRFAPRVTPATRWLTGGYGLRV